jgi:purine-binding chemotaxis protein CheW
MHDQLFASFILDTKLGLEIALKAENVTEATPLNGSIQRLPTAIDYLEGVMTLREDIIPVINMKKRLGLDDHRYPADAKVAVVTMHNQQFGLLFDDIQEVFKAAPEIIMPINSLLQGDDRIISAIIKRNKGKRTVELLDLGHLFKGKSFTMPDLPSAESSAMTQARQTTYSRWVVFTCFGRPYGVPIKYAREIAFFSTIDDLFQSDNIEGAIQLRGTTIPVLSGRFLLAGNRENREAGEDNRVLILASDDCSFGMLVDEINEILTIADDLILPVLSGGSDNLLGIYPRQAGEDIMLLDMPNLVCGRIEDIKSLARINGSKSGETPDRKSIARSHHLITENCYLIFAVNKRFAIELKDVQEIIESENIMTIPRSTGYSSAVINLRGVIVPVINVRHFFGYPADDTEAGKLIICRGRSRIIALLVDRIITIYKQEEYHSTPSLNPQLSAKKDTLDRLIEYEGEDGLQEHILVINIDNMVGNHLDFKEPPQETSSAAESESESESENI